MIKKALQGEAIADLPIASTGARPPFRHFGLDFMLWSVEDCSA